ncbi:hypothetical protein IGK75_000309 [Enterococcus sp. AZ159]|jgi:hypothetical protein
MKVSIEDVINGYRSDAPVDLERDAYAEELYQEAIKIWNRNEYQVSFRRGITRNYELLDWKKSR